MGFCDAFLLLSWVTLWSTIANGGVLKSICFSYVMAFALYHVFLLLPYEMQAFVVVALLPVSAFCLMFGGNELRRRFPLELQSAPLNAFQKKGSLVLAIAVLHLIFGLSQVFNQAAIGTNTLPNTVMTGLLILLTTMIILVQSDPEDSVSLLYRSVFLGIVVFVVLAVAPLAALSSVAFGFMRFAMFALDTLTILLAADYAFRMHKPAYRVFGVLFSISRLSSFAGFFATSYIASSRPNDNDVLICLLLFSLLAVVFLQIAVFSQDDLRSIFCIPKVAPAEQQDDSLRIASFARTFDLSARETEVFEYLIKGRSVPYLCEKLYISPNTGKRHVSNIYRKTCVYNKQSLLDLFDAFKRTDTQDD
ncbi:LuxR C-terminal-related transcriptional regulator [Eggerthella sp. YY7918]|uniref:helix-turn-helix transcriptional regulator n=1 Tax=Eggerthella sp. (strain YY7918) TaxID=502558 RepID=UPI00021718F4|nr:LuxR C-terminal-related transcriptional regulator [Eggerthella sp. YY7918]BAK45701.1 hypothetical protein EGYY_27040 [Eggerthella sp. YY7918]